MRLLRILKTLKKSLFSDWPGDFGATAAPLSHVMTCTGADPLQGSVELLQGSVDLLQGSVELLQGSVRSCGRKGHCIASGGGARKNALQTHRVHSVHTAGAENTIF